MCVLVAAKVGFVMTVVFFHIACAVRRGLVLFVFFLVCVCVNFSSNILLLFKPLFQPQIQPHNLEIIQTNPSCIDTFMIVIQFRDQNDFPVRNEWRFHHVDETFHTSVELL